MENGKKSVNYGKSFFILSEYRLTNNILLSRKSSNITNRHDDVDSGDNDNDDDYRMM